MKLGLLVAAAVIATSTPMVAAQAASAVYTISGIGSGSLDGTAFNGAAFTFKLTGDTTGLSFNVLDPLGSATASIAGFADVSFSFATRLGVAGGNIIYFSRSSIIGGLDLFDFQVPVAVDLGVSFGPLAGSNVFALNQFVGVATSGGALTFDAASNVAFSGVIGTVAPPGVPEASTWVMLIAGFGLVGAAMRRRTAVTA